jgi:Low molecular weight phosphotyrosine protein phosphatase
VTIAAAAHKRLRPPVQLRDPLPGVREDRDSFARARYYGTVSHRGSTQVAQAIQDYRAASFGVRQAEVGIDLSRAFPKPLTDQAVRAADVVVTMGCGDACPIYPGKRYEDWQLQDPAGQSVEVVRGIRDEIDGRVRQLLAELDPAPG